MSWFESIEQAFDIDITSIQDSISTGLQETTKLGEFLNLDALEQQQEKEEDDDDDYDNDEFISFNNNITPVKKNNNIDSKIVANTTAAATATTNTTTTTTTASNNNNDNNEDDLTSPWDWTPPKNINNDNKDIVNSAHSDKLSVVDLNNSPNVNTAITIKLDNEMNNIKNERKPINNTLKINKKNNNSNSNNNSNNNSNKCVEIYASEYVGKVKKPRAKKTSKKDGLDFFGLSSTSISSSAVTSKIANISSDGINYGEEEAILIKDNTRNSSSIDENDVNNIINDENDKQDSSSYSIAIDAIMKSLPQRLTESAAYYSQVEKVFSFFDDDDEIDLDNDPILKQVKENKEKGPSLFREYSTALAVFDGVSVYTSPLVSPMKDNSNNQTDDDDNSDENQNKGGGIKEIVIWIQSLQSEMIMMINECRDSGNINNTIIKILSSIYYCLKSLLLLIIQLILFIIKNIIQLFYFILSKLRNNNNRNY